MELGKIFQDGLLQYLLLCVVSIAMGLGLLRLFRMDLPLRMAVAFAPVLTAACWAIVLGIGVALDVPVRLLAGPLWVLTGGLALNSLIGALVRARVALRAAPQHNLGLVASSFGSRAALRQSDLRLDVRQGWLLAVCVVLPLAVMFPYFLAGLADHPRSTFPDGWAYVAFGQYLWSYSRGTDGGLAPLYQFAAHLSHTRFIASSLLGFLSPFFSAGDTQMASGLFLAWGLFTFASSCAFFGLTQRLAAPWLCIYLILTVFSGWVCNMLWANNYDNALALVYFPALIGAVTWLKPRGCAWRFMLGLLGAGLLYSYPELALVILGGAAIVAISRYRVERHDANGWIITAMCALCMMVLLVLLYIPEMYAFIYGQAVVGLKASKRPGEGLFGGLLQVRYLPAALWGLGGEYALNMWLPLRNALGVVLTGMSALGFLQLIKQRRVGFATLIVLLVAGCGFFIVVQRYSYGAYKMLLLVWWALCYMIVLGLNSLLLRFRRGVPRYVAIGLSTLTLLLTLTFNHYGVEAPSKIASTNEHLDMSQFRQLEQLKQITGGAGMLVMVDDWVASEWAVYFLRDMPIALSEYRMYMAQPHVIPLMKRAKPLRPAETRYVLTDAVFDTGFSNSPHAKLVWSGGPYHLWATDLYQGAIITAITNALGIQQVDNQSFFWMGKGDTTLAVLAPKSGVLHLVGTFLPGPSVPDRAERDLLVLTDAGYRNQVTLINGDQSISLPIAAGKTTVTLRPLDTPTLKALANGDIRPLVLGVQGISTVLDDNLATLEQVQNPYGIRKQADELFFWMGQEPTRLRVATIQAGKLTLQAHFLPGPSLPETTVRRVLVESDSGYREEVSIPAGDQQIMLPVQSGTTTITLTVLDTPTLTKLANGDPRTLLLGVQDLTVRLEP
ncbi:MAG: hypothetical protein ACJ8CR_06700 [Roseiflexaceae bacterium]